MRSAIRLMVRRAMIPTFAAWSLVATAGEVRLMTTSDAVSAASKTHDGYQRDYTSGFLADRLGITQKAAKLPGTFLRDKNGEKIAKVQDIVLDLTSGRIACVLVSVDSSTVAVPPACFRSADECGAVLNMDKSSLSDAPHPAASDLATVFNSLPQAYSYFGQSFGSQPLPSQLCRSTSLIGLRVRNASNEQLGSVVNLMVDVPTARVIYAVVSFAGSASDLYAIPTAALRLAPDQSAVVVNASREKIAGLAHSDSFFWANLGDVCWGGVNYQTFGLQADFDSPSKKSDATHEEVRAKVDAAAAMPKCDSDVQRDILMALMHEDVNNSYTYRNVKITASKGQVTLTGRVKNDKQHSKLLSIVSSVAGAANVNDQVEVK